jgi:Family of unknown function (DUF6527)
MSGLKDHPPGYWLFVEDGEMEFFCPCGCGNEWHIRVYLGGTIKRVSPSWMWNGDEVRPSLHPSIKVHGPCGFHGYLTAGQWNNAQKDGAPIAPNVYGAPP